VVLEDQTLPTVLFQNVLAKLRQLLKAVGQSPDANNVGVFAAISEATHGRGQKITDAGHDVNAIMQQLNTVVKSDDTGPTTLSALKAAAESLRTVSPDLFTALDSSVQPMRTFAEKRTQLTNFLTGGLNTTGTLGDAFDHQTDRMIQISTGLTPGLGVIADHAGEFHGVSTRLQTLANKFYDQAWNPETNMMTIKAAVSLAPSRTYIRADCPRYGAMEGPSCKTAPETPTAPDLKPGLESMGMATPPWVTENRPNIAPPRFSVPIVPDFPGPPDPDAPPAPQAAPAPGPQAVPTPAGPPLPAEAGAPGQIQQQSAPLFGGTVGPVGSQLEKDQLSQIVGGPATSAQQLLLAPVARGSDVSVTPAPGAADAGQNGEGHP
ncbi:MAG: mammalian cell entry protein, partial [Mycolicibacterium sp.]